MPNYYQNNLLLLLNDHLSELSLRDFKNLNSRLLGNIGFHAPNLEKLNMSGISIKDDVLIHLSQALKKLVFLDISYVSGLSEEGIGICIKNLSKSITDLNLNACGDCATDESLSEL